MNTAAIAREDVVALIAHIETLPGLSAYAQHRLDSAREALGRYDARPYWWTAENYRLALRDADNAARLALRYAQVA